MACLSLLVTQEKVGFQQVIDVTSSSVLCFLLWDLEGDAC